MQTDKINFDNTRLNDQQLDMIRLFKNPMSEQDFLQMRRLAVQLLAKKLDMVTESWEKENNITDANYDILSKQHLRTPYKNS